MLFEPRPILGDAQEVQDDQDERCLDGRRTHILPLRGVIHGIAHTPLLCKLGLRIGAELVVDQHAI